MAKKEDPPLPRATKVVNAWAKGDESQAEEVFRLLDEPFNRVTKRLLSREDRLNGILDPGELKNELFLELGEDFRRHNNRWFENTAAFMGMVATMLRRRLSDMAKRGGASKPKPGQVTGITVIGQMGAEPRAVDLLDLDFALERLEQRSPDLAKAVELVYYLRMTIDEAAEAMAMPHSTFRRRLRAAIQWLEIQLTRSAEQRTRPSQP
jgi:DNA-directed RNA polymerase specialized sigma24 family protein